MEFNKSNRFNDNNESQANQNLIHYAGEIGEFDYDPNIWEISDYFGRKYLHFRNVYVENLELPKGLTSCYRMFDFCKLPENFTLGDKFNTVNVTDMRSMFEDCEIPEGFSLGEKFDTSHVTNMSAMFMHCELPAGFTLGDNFDTSSVKDMTAMFSKCSLPEGFTLGEKFNTSSVKIMKAMFEFCKLPRGINNQYNAETIIEMLKYK